MEFCSSTALNDICCNIDEKINDRSFSRVSFDIMLAWEKPSSADEEQESFSVGAHPPFCSLQISPNFWFCSQLAQGI